MERRFSPDPVRYTTMTTRELREHFLIESLFTGGKETLVYSDLDRAVIGSVVPESSPIPLSCPDELKAEFFNERRELGLLNVGGTGTVSADGISYPLEHKDCLYIGRGVRTITFASNDPHNPAAFYLVSFPAHASHPTVLARRANASAVELGKPEDANKRTIYKYIHEDGIRSCQLVMGFTELATGSVWNTMPPHTHTRRMEIYMYFGMNPRTRVIHLMGTPDETRHLILADREAVLSPPWSIHAGAGTGEYSFCWTMGGENQAFTDMDGVQIESLR